MTVKKIGRFYRDEYPGGYKLPSLGLDSSNLEACIKEIKDNHIEAVFGASIFDFDESNLDFFQEIPFIKQVELWGVNLSNIEGLYYLKNLEAIFFNGNKPPAINYSKFLKLKYVIDVYNKNDTGLEKLLKVKEFYSNEFKPKNKSFSTFPVPPNIERLEITKANPLNLDGMPHFKNLKRISFHYCRNLESIENLKNIAPNLEFLRVEKCSRLKAYDSVDQLPKARFININGEILVDKD